MKNFDPTNHSQDEELERELRQITLPRPPASWRSSVMPAPPVPWLPASFLMAVGGCWSVAAVVFLTTPDFRELGPPVPVPAPSEVPQDFLLGLNSQERITP